LSGNPVAQNLAGSLNFGLSLSGFPPVGRKKGSGFNRMERRRIDMFGRLWWSLGSNEIDEHSGNIHRLETHKLNKDK
jgi:hypothetical protein